MVFGIHGSNVLDTVAKNLFENSMAININLVNNNQLPTEIFTKTFLIQWFYWEDVALYYV